MAKFSDNTKAVEVWHGRVTINKTACKPLEKMLVSISQLIRGAKEYLAVWLDGLGKPYGRKFGFFSDSGDVSFEFTTGGAPGMQFLTVCFDPKQGADHDRILIFLPGSIH